MPTINVTNHTELDLAASFPDNNGTLKQYLKQDLRLIAPDGFEAVAAQPVKATDASGFPIQLSPTGSGKFVVEKTTLTLQTGACASLGLLKGDDVKTILSSVNMADPSIANLVVFALKGTMSVGDTATVSDFTFGITDNSSFTLTSYVAAADNETIGAAISRALGALTIPHRIDDIGGLPANACCQVDASGSLKFSASVTHSFLNNPLATVPIPRLPKIAIKAGGSVTLEASVTHTSDHTLTVAKLPSGLLHLSVSITGTGDFETSLTASAGISANVGDQDALTFLLGIVSPDSAHEIAQLKQDMPADQVTNLTAAIKAAIDAAICKSLQLSLKAALDKSKSHSTVFVYEIDPKGLDSSGSAALAAALTGDFTAMTRPSAQFAGIRELASTVTDISKTTHSLAIHLLGIFNWNSMNTFLKRTTVSSVNGSQLVLCDETVDVALNNLDADKLRQVVLKSATLTLPAIAAQDDGATMSLVFFEREASTKPGRMREFVNTLRAVGLSAATDRANALLGRGLENYGTCSLYLGLSLTSAQCAKLFASTDPMTFIIEYCGDETTILSGNPESASRLKLFGADQATWIRLQHAGAASNIVSVLKSIGIPESAPPEALVPDVVTGLWWSSAMANYARALVAHDPLDKAGAQVVKAGTLGFGEPWMVLAAWNLLGNPPMQTEFTSSLL